MVIIMYKILLADDEGIVIDSLKYIIEKEFKDLCEIQTAKTGRMVIELAESFRPDIAVMDIQMPGINGIEAMREIRRTNSNVIFIKNIQRLSEYLLQNGINNKILYGATPVANEDMSDEEFNTTREGIVKEFNSADSSFKVVIANPFAVAESISLHKACHNAIYLERSFNCAHYMQSKDRIHRYGLPQDIETHYYYILSEDSIDLTIDDRLEEKERRMLEIIENMPIPLFSNITDEGDDDIKAILTDYVKRKTRKTL